MKRIFLLLCLLSVAATSAWAHTQPPITRYVQTSKTVCVVKVTAIEDGVITFTVEEIVKGAPPNVLKLRVVYVPTKITQDSEWLLASTPANENTIGWANKGDYGWVNAPIQRVDGKIHLMGNYGYVDPSLAKDASKGFTLEQMKDLAQKPLPKY